MKNITKLLSLLIIICILTAVLWGCGDDSLTNEEISKILGSDALPITYALPQYAINMADLRQVVGDADYVFVCKVSSYNTTEYLSNLNNFPLTLYNIEIIENIKGELKQSEQIVLKKAGGISQDHKSFWIYQDDSLLKVNSYYIISVYTQPDGGILTGGINSHLTIENPEDYVAEANYIAILDAYQNEIVIDRGRYECKYDVSYDEN
ncbi:MAG: hypothetical protein LBF12_04500 [Christensenellaceae bacterium]|jgi:hypothetical protein|nr:hypothetical protein [Christensenellaceae bacterium]